MIHQTNRQHAVFLISIYTNCGVKYTLMILLLLVCGKNIKVALTRRIKDPTSRSPSISTMEHYPTMTLLCYCDYSFPPSPLTTQSSLHLVMAKFPTKIIAASTSFPTPWPQRLMTIRFCCQHILPSKILKTSMAMCSNPENLQWLLFGHHFLGISTLFLAISMRKTMMICWFWIQLPWKRW